MGSDPGEARNLPIQRSKNVSAVSSSAYRIKRQQLADSAASTAQPAESSVYTATKAAVEAITGVLSKELGARKPAAGSTLVSQTPLGRTGQLDDIADIAVFLVSDASRWLTGEKLIASGGLR